MPGRVTLVLGLGMLNELSLVATCLVECKESIA